MGALQTVAITTKPISVFFLGIDRIFCVIFPFRYLDRKRYYPLIGTCIFVIIFVVINLLLRILNNLPENEQTKCSAFGCMTSAESGVVYVTMRYTLGGANLILGIILALLIKKKLNLSSLMVKSNRLALLTLTLTFLLDLVPHILSSVLYAAVISTCPNGTYEVISLVNAKWNCLLYYTEDTDYFAQAEPICRKYNGYLISITNGFDNEYVSQLASAIFGNARAWIGVSKLMGDTWRNVDDGSNTIFFNWAPNEPNPNDDNICVSIDSQGYWYAEPCDAYHHFICGVPEENQTTSTTSPSTTVSSQYLPCKSFISFSADISQVLSAQAFENQLSFIASALNQINHPEMIDYNSGPNLVVPWMSGISLHEIQNQVTGTKKDNSISYRLRPILGGIFSALESIELNSTPIGSIVFVTDTTTAGSIDGADQYATMLKNQGVKLTFILMGPNVDQNKLTNLTTNFVTWTDLTKPQPDNWDPLSAFACPGSST